MIDRRKETNSWILCMTLFVIPIVSIMSTGYFAFFGSKEQRNWGKVSLIITLALHIIIFVIFIRFFNMPYTEIYDILSKIK